MLRSPVMVISEGLMKIFKLLSKNGICVFGGVNRCQIGWLKKTQRLAQMKQFTDVNGVSKRD